MNREALFREYDQRNPQLWEQFERLAFEAMRKGHQHIGSNLISARIRWETGARAEDGEYKFNEKWLPFYARKFAREYPQHAGFFRFRRLKEERA
jgi:hypothetical protein